jgi:hypothetical protein
VELKDIVFARDPSILDPQMRTVNQRDALMHENLLDVKNLLKKREIIAD